MSKRQRIEDWERIRYGPDRRWFDLGPLPVFRIVAQGPGEPVNIPEWRLAA